MTFTASRGSIFGYAADINMALGTEERVITEHPSLSPRGGGLRNKKGGPEVEKSGLIIFGLPPPTRFPTRQGVNFQGFVWSPGAPRKPQRDSSEISLTEQKCCSGCFRRILLIARLTVVLALNMRNCGGGVVGVVVGNTGESRNRVTEGGQECVQGMLGNQQVLSCACVLSPPPTAIKAGSGLRGGRFALETRCSCPRSFPSLCK